jgi:hypothetical protein
MEPVNAAYRVVQVAATSSNGGADCSRQAAIVFDDLGRRKYTHTGAWNGGRRCDGSTPVRRNRFLEKPGEGTGKVKVTPGRLKNLKALKK